MILIPWDVLLPTGLLEEQLLVKVVRDKLMSNPCKNQGFVLDGFPKSYEQARELFSGEIFEPGAHRSLLPSVVHRCNCTRSLFTQTNKNQKMCRLWLPRKARGFCQVELWLCLQSESLQRFKGSQSTFSSPVSVTTSCSNVFQSAWSTWTPRTSCCAIES